MKPRIGVTRGTSPVLAYRRALEAAGAEVVELGPETMLARAADLDPQAALEGLDGLLLPGGADIDPRLYGEREVHPSVRVTPERDRLELGLARAALARGLPVLGICRGIQTLNVAAGGDLWQDLPSQYPGALVHKEPDEDRDRRRLLHPVTLSPDSLTGRLLDCRELPVNSIHHQAVRRVAPGFRVVATAPDGVVEAIESTEAPFVLGVQWHPEELWEDHRTHARLFAAFCRAAGGGT